MKQTLISETLAGLKIIHPINNKLLWDYMQNTLRINMQHVKANNNLIEYIWDQDPKCGSNMS